MKLLVLALALLQNVVSVDFDVNSILPSPLMGNLKGRNGETFLDLSIFSHLTDQVILKERSVYQKRNDIKKYIRASSEARHEVVFSIKENLDDLTALVDDISDPFSANYGKHLNREEVSAMTANPASFQHVLAYLSHHEIEVVKISKYSEYITAVAPVSKWEEVFATEFYEFEMEGEEAKLIRAEHYSLSEYLHDHVSGVFNTVQFPLPTRPKSRNPDAMPLTSNGLIYNGYVTPDLLYNVYDIRNNTGNHLGSQAFFGIDGQSFSQEDLTEFESFFGLPSQTVGSTGELVSNACYNSIEDCMEANLDVQYLTAVSQITPTTYYYWSGTDFLLDWVTSVANMSNPAKVISISWGGVEDQFGESYITAFNAQAVKLVAMGVTIVASSGDDGASNFVSRDKPKYCGYNADFPAVSYYVTSVGASMGPEMGMSEEACQVDKGGHITSGGGFSEFFSAPSWQTGVISAYFSTMHSNGATIFPGYNAAGRGFPDVSLLGRDYITINNGSMSVVSGTSASAPVFAGMVALVNAKRLAAGKSTLGWINPALYALHSQFVNDVTSGDNHCGYGKVCCAQGFEAAVGWDPVTGLGSVNFTSFEAAMFALGNAPNIPSASPSVVPGSPSSHPVSTPTNLPQMMPTPAPSVSAGWVYGSYYTDTECVGVAPKVDGWKMGTCFTGYSGDSSSVYFKYSCDSVHAYVSVFSDSACANQIYVGRSSLGCSPSDVYYYYGPEYSYSLNCSLSENRPLDNSITYAMLSFYDDLEGCSDDLESVFFAYQNDYCFAHPRSSYALKYSYPKVYAYDTDSCNAGHRTGVTLPTYCVADLVDDYFFSYYSYFHIMRSVMYKKVVATAPTAVPSEAPFSPTDPTALPSVIPVRRPTTAPTSEEIYIMSVSQDLSGVTASQFNTDFDMNAQIFSAAVSNCLEVVSAKNVTVSSVVDAAETRLRRLTGSGVTVDYTVQYNLGDLGYSGDPDGAYSFLGLTLDEAVATHAFDVHLTLYNRMYNGTCLNLALSSNVECNGYSAVSNEDDDAADGSGTDDTDDMDVSGTSSDGGLSATNRLIIGLVVGVGGFFVLLFVITCTVVVYGMRYAKIGAGDDSDGLIELHG